MRSYATYSAQNALAMAQLARIAYHKQNPSRVRGRLAAIDDMALVDFIADDGSDTQGFIAASPSAIAVAFRGSESPRDALTDVRVAQVEPAWSGARGRVHRGFHDACAAVRERVHDQVAALRADRAAALRADTARPRPVCVVGHSLGAALAILYASSLAAERAIGDITVYALGAPKVGDEAFASYYNDIVPNTYRIWNHRDIVPTLPGPRYCHVGTQKRYDAEGRLITEAPRGPSFADHALKRYLAALERLASAP